MPSIGARANYAVVQHFTFIWFALGLTLELGVQTHMLTTARVWCVRCAGPRAALREAFVLAGVVTVEAGLCMQCAAIMQSPAHHAPKPRSITFFVLLFHPKPARTTYCAHSCAHVAFFAALRNDFPSCL